MERDCITDGLSCDIAWRAPSITLVREEKRKRERERGKSGFERFKLEYQEK